MEELRHDFINWKKLSLSEYTSKNPNTEPVTDLDVTTIGFSHCKTLAETGQLCKNCNFNAFFSKLAYLPASKRKRFIDHQTELRKDKIQFLEEVNGILRDYDKQFNEIDYNIYSDYSSIVDDKLNELSGGSATSSPLRFTIPLGDEIKKLFTSQDEQTDTPTLVWNKRDTDLLELITALVESRSIQNSTGSLTRTEAISTFQKIFGIEIKDAESKLSRATERKKSLTPFLDDLKLSFEQYCYRKVEK